MLRFGGNCKRAIKDNQLIVNEISLDEKKQAKWVWLINEQSQINYKQMNQLKTTLGAYRDEGGIIKLKGRLEHAENTNSRFPILIPKDSYIGDLIILDAHKYVLHYGMKDTLNELNTGLFTV